MADWASVADVLALTGVTVTAQTRTLAASAIELHTGALEAVVREGMSDRDAYWLKTAVCYQAAWLAAQPDYLERNSVTSVAQDGQSATAINGDWLTLAPLARKAVKRLSWRGSRAIVVARDTTLVLVADPLSDTSDDKLSWQGMGS